MSHVPLLKDGVHDSPMRLLECVTHALQGHLEEMVEKMETVKFWPLSQQALQVTSCITYRDIYNKVKIRQGGKNIFMGSMSTSQAVLVTIEKYHTLLHFL